MGASVHPTAIVDPRAKLGVNVEVGPFCIVGPGVTLGDGVRLVSHVAVTGTTRLGARVVVFPFASIGAQTQDLKYRGAESAVEVGEDTTLREGVTVNAGTWEGECTRIGRRCHILAYAHVAHACSLGDEVIMANAALLAGEVEVGAQAVLGAMSMVHQFCRIGRLCMIGAASKIVKDVPPFMLANGNPCRVRGINVVGCRRRGLSSSTRLWLARAFKLLYKSPLARAQSADRIERLDAGTPELLEIAEFVRQSRRGVL